jgi:thymidylate synthase ThyX
MSGSALVYSDLRSAELPDVAPYAVSMAYRLRFYMDMDAREAMHIIELRTAHGGHPNYRWLCQEMRRQIADVAGHRVIAAAMSFTDESSADLGRLEAEQRSDAKRASLVSAAE